MRVRHRFQQKISGQWIDPAVRIKSREAVKHSICFELVMFDKATGKRCAHTPTRRDRYIDEDGGPNAGIEQSERTGCRRAKYRSHHPKLQGLNNTKTISKDDSRIVTKLKTDF